MFILLILDLSDFQDCIMIVWFIGMVFFVSVCQQFVLCRAMSCLLHALFS